MKVRVVSASSDLLIFLDSFIQTLGTEAKMSKLESAMDTIIDVFKYYSSKEGDKFKLSRGELKNLLRGELNLEASRNPMCVQAIMCDLDKNWDGSVSFEEFVAMVTKLTVYCASFFEGYTPVL